MSEQFFQVSPVQRLVEQVLEHHGTMYAVDDVILKWNVERRCLAL